VTAAADTGMMPCCSIESQYGHRWAVCWHMVVVLLCVLRTCAGE
jgi:hypothetical protein